MVTLSRNERTTGDCRTCTTYRDVSLALVIRTQEHFHFVKSIRPPKNVIIEYEQPRAHHEQIVIDEGVFRADPQSHNATSTTG